MIIDAQPAYVLHTRAYRDTSGLIDFFTRDYGRITLLAKGYKTARKRAAISLQPFRPMVISWSGKSDLKLLRSAEESGPPALLDARAMNLALYVNELLFRLVHPHDPSPALFDGYVVYLHEAAQGVDPEFLLRRFEKTLLEEIGYGLRLTHTCDDQQVRQDLCYCYLPEDGPVDMPGGCVQGLKVRGSTLLALELGDLSDPEIRKEAKSLMRYLIDYYLDGRPLKSRDLYRFY